MPFASSWFVLRSILLTLLVFCVVVFVCLRLLCRVCPMLPVSLDSPFLIVPSCYQCLWIVHSWLSLRFFLTFISLRILYFCIKRSFTMNYFYFLQLVHWEFTKLFCMICNIIIQRSIPTLSGHICLINKLWNSDIADKLLWVVYNSHL
jgi:hypothetical protein